MDKPDSGTYSALREVAVKEVTVTCHHCNAPVTIRVMPEEAPDGYFEGRYWLLVSFLRNILRGREFRYMHPDDQDKLIREKLEEVKLK